MATSRALRHAARMISGLKIGNFKAFGPAQEIPLRPLTLVFGPNSAGKSSIIQALLLARHIQDTGNVDAHQTTLGGAAVDLGGFTRYVHKHDEDSDVSIEFTFDRGEITRRLYFLKEFETIRIAYAVGKTHSAQNSSKVINSVTLWLDDYELVHFSRQDNGELHVDEAALLNRSLIVQCEIWNRDDFEDWKYLRARLRRWESHGVNEVAQKYGLRPGDLIDPISGKPSLKGAMLTEWARAAADDEDEVPQIARELRDHPRSPSENEQRDKAAHLRQLLDMRFRIESLAIKNIGSLPRERDDFDIWGSDRVVDNPEYDHPFQFFKRYLKEDEKLEEPELSAEASAMAFRFDLECLIESASERVQPGLRGISYLGPLRWIPPRIIPDGEQFDASWTAGGGDAWQRLRREPELLARVNHFLQDTLRSRYRLECQYYALVKSAGGSAESSHVAEEPPPASKQRATNDDETITRLSIVDADTDLKLSHRDVGTGISQLLPVLVNAAGAKEGLIAIEQPELHLHPALQAELGDVFIESALGENKNTFLIETHSEHLLLRIMRRIRQTAQGTLPEGAKPITPNDVALLYVSPGAEGSVVQEIGLNERGELVKGWPGGFFEEGFNEMFS